MIDQITTKPMRSQAQWGYLFANDMPFARRWARETPGGKGKRFRKLPPKVSTKANYGAKRGQVIAGRLVRGEGGRFSSSGAAPAATPSKRVPPKKLPSAPKGKKGGGRKGGATAKPKKTEEQRAQEQEVKRQERARQREAERQATRDKVLADLGIDPGAAEALVMLSNGEQPQPEALARMGAEAAGLVERAADGSFRMTPAGRQLLNAAERGDAGMAGDVISRARDRKTARTEADAKRAAAAAEKKPASGGGKGKKPPKPSRTTPTRSSGVPQLPRASGGAGGGGSPARQESTTLPADVTAAARALSNGETLSDRQAELLVSNGLARRNRDGTLSLTAMGQRAIRQKSFAVFKDATGAWRWIARTTTAFEDRDREVISTKALADSAQSDAPRGPLRFWHMGRPDPLSADRPWGPGVDLGWCDFAALSGKTLIESGTFKSDAIARAVAAKADELELSPGFFHAAGEPDASGVFHHIRMFERSLVPKWAGRASNRYTGLVVEKTMDQKKVEALKAMGIDAAALKELLAEVETTEKAAEAEGVRYKESRPVLDFFRALITGEQAAAKEEAAPAVESEPEQPAAETDPIALLTAELKSLREEVAALKAGPPAPMEETIVETQAEGDEMMEETTEIVDDTGGEMGWDEVLAGFGQVLDEKLGPLVEALGITTKLDGHMGELKSLLGGYVKTKDDRDAQLRATVDQHQAQLAELIDDKPRGGYRPTQAPDNTLPAILAATVKDGAMPTDDNPFADLIAQLIPGAAQQ